MANLVNYENLSAVLQELAKDIRERYVANLEKNGHFTTLGSNRRLIDSVTTYVEMSNGTTYEVKMRLNDYWKYVENDTRPHFPPPSAMMQWVEIKPVIPRPDSNGKVPTPKQLAYLIGRKIAAVGTKGTHDLENAKEDIFAQYRERIQEALGKDLRAYLSTAMYLG